MNLDLNEKQIEKNPISTVSKFFFDDVLLFPLGEAARIDTPHIIKDIPLSTSRLLMEAWKFKQHKSSVYVNTRIQKSNLLQ